MPTATRSPRAQPIRPWLPGLIAPARLGPGPCDSSHETVDRPTPIRALPEVRGVRGRETVIPQVGGRDASSCGHNGVGGSGVGKAANAMDSA